METLQISPNILRWAADQRGLSLDALVNLVGKPKKHQALVAGQFSITEAENLAKKLIFLLAIFFLIPRLSPHKKAFLTLGNYPMPNP